MRRILIAQRSSGWGFDGDGKVVLAESPLLAGVEAREYGESLQGRALGYIIRLDTGKELVTLHMRVFGVA
jgi:hypothetical protein